jgi:hypothetical protein
MTKQIKNLLTAAFLALSEDATPAQRSKTLTDIANFLEDPTTDKDKQPWWVVALKVLAYLIGLLLAGYGTPAAAATVGLL